MGLSMEKQTNGEMQLNMHEEMRRAFSLLSGKWKLEIMWLLNQRLYRFGELRKAIPGITQHMLTAQLRELEADGLVSRTVFAEVPPRVEYEITEKARGSARRWQRSWLGGVSMGKACQSGRPCVAAQRGRQVQRRHDDSEHAALCCPISSWVLNWQRFMTQR